MWCEDESVAVLDVGGPPTLNPPLFSLRHRQWLPLELGSHYSTMSFSFTPVRGPRPNFPTRDFPPIGGGCGSLIGWWCEERGRGRGRVKTKTIHRFLYFIASGIWNRLYEALRVSIILLWLLFFYRGFFFLLLFFSNGKVVLDLVLYEMCLFVRFATSSRISSLSNRAVLLFFFIFMADIAWFCCRNCLLRSCLDVLYQWADYINGIFRRISPTDTWEID